MDTIPNEIALHIYSFCDLESLVNVKQTNKLNRARVHEILRKVLFFRPQDRLQYMDDMNSECTQASKKILKFMRLMPNVRRVAFVDLPARITLTELIAMNLHNPYIRHIEFVQKKFKFIERDAFLGLRYMRNLRSLKIVNWNPTQVVRRGCSSRIETIPKEILQNLEVFDISGDGETVENIFSFMEQYEVYMERIETLKIHVRITTSQVSSLIFRFIIRHPHLKEIAFNGLLFDTQHQVQEFYMMLMVNPQLRILDIENCAVVERLENAISRTFVERLFENGVRLVGQVRSLRHI